VGRGVLVQVMLPLLMVVAGPAAEIAVVVTVTTTKEQGVEVVLAVETEPLIVRVRCVVLVRSTPHYVEMRVKATRVGSGWV